MFNLNLACNFQLVEKTGSMIFMNLWQMIRGKAWFYLIVINFLVFAAEQSTYLMGLLLKYGALSQSNAFSMPWAWIVTLFIHSGPEHIFLNMYALFLFGPLLESKIGIRKFLTVYFSAGLIANIGFLLTSPAYTTVGIGASGAIFGILACLAVIEPNFQIVVFPFPLPLPLWIASIFYFISELTLTGNFDSIAHFAHVLGIVTGFVWGYRLKLKNSEDGFEN